MKITAVNTYFVRPRWGFVVILTDEGFVGWGEAVLEGHAKAVLACVEEMKDYLIDQNPMNIEGLWSTMYRAGFYRGGGDSFGAALIYSLLSDYEEQKAINFAVASSCLKHSIEHDFNLVSVAEVESLANGNAS